MPTIQLALGRSNRLFWLLGLLYSWALLTTVYTGWVAVWSGWVTIALSLSVVAGFVYHYRLHVSRQARRAIIGLTYLPASGRWLLLRRDGRLILTNISPQSVLISGLALLNFNQCGYILRNSVVFCPDAVTAGSYRHLRKWWRSYGQTSRSV
jgi:hypothetical protein